MPPSPNDDFDRLRQKLTQENTFTPGRVMDEERAIRNPDEPGPIRTWSFSTLKSFEECPYRVFLSKVECKPHPPAGRALERGTRIHDAAERYIKGRTDTLDADLVDFRTGMDRLRRYHADERVNTEIEEDWGFTMEWEPVSWQAPDLWAKMKLDAFVQDHDDSCYVIDFKTGRAKGNEIKHTDQGITYMLGALMRYPDIQFVQVEFWYTDQNEKMIKTYTREEGVMLLPALEKRAYSLTNCHDFEPRPDRRTCRWCPHRETGECLYAEG